MGGRHFTRQRPDGLFDGGEMDSLGEHGPLLVPAGQNVGEEIRDFVGVQGIDEAGGHDGGGGDLTALDVTLVHHGELPG